MNDKRATVPAFHDTAGVEDPRVLFSGALASREGSGAGDGARTRDILLGKQTPCQLSYSRSGDGRESSARRTIGSMTGAPPS